MANGELRMRECIFHQINQISIFDCGNVNLHDIYGINLIAFKMLHSLAGSLPKVPSGGAAVWWSRESAHRNVWEV